MVEAPQFHIASHAGLTSLAHRRCVGSERAFTALREDYRQQLKEVRTMCGFEMVRFHGLLCDDMELVKSVDGDKVELDFAKVDDLFDFILSIGMKPFVELSFMPTLLSSGTKTIFWYKGNVTLPRSLSLWSNLIFGLVSHLRDRYGEDEVVQWYFEVWNEPDLPNFFHGSQSDYFALYQASASAIKSVSQRFRVGGPATAEHRWIGDFLNYAASTNTPVDFISSHGYCVEGMLDQDGKRRLMIPLQESMFVDGVNQTAKTVRDQGKDLEIHYTEWSISYSSRDPVHDHYFSPAYLLSRIFLLRNQVASLSYWTFSDIFEELGPPDWAFHGGFGLLTTDGLRKPAFFLFHYLSKLLKFELRNSERGVWMTTDGSGVTGLIWCERELPPGQSNQALFIQELPPERDQQRSVELSGLMPGEYRLKISTVGYEKNDLYTPYLRMGRPAKLDADQIAALASRTSLFPERDERRVVGVDGRCSVCLTLREGDVVFLEITPT